jgi:hypothetical protein
MRVVNALLLVVFLTGLILSPLLFGYEPVGGDPDRIYRPIKAELARSLRSGHLPFWSDRFGLGAPLIAESHAAALYPPNLLLYRLLDVSVAYRLSMWLHYVLLVAATFAYAHSLGISPWGGAIAGLAFTFCGFQAIQSSHEWAVHALPYLPLVLLLAARYTTTGRLRWLAWLALASGAQWTLGHFQIQTWTAGLALFTGLWAIIAQGRPWRRLIGLLVGLIWGGAIAAVQLALTWELAQFVGYTRRPLAELMFYSFPPAHWAQLAAPWVFRDLPGGPEAAYWFGQQTTGFEACFYVGTIPILLVTVALVAGRLPRGLAPWLVLVPVTFAVATMPRWWPAGYAALLQVPGLGYFRAPARYTVLSSLGLSLLAGAGLDPTISRTRFRCGVGLALLFGLTGLAWGFTWFLVVMNGPRVSDHEPLGEVARFLVAWAVALLAIAAWRTGRLGSVVLVLAASPELAALYYGGTTQWGWSIRLPEESPVLNALARAPKGVRVIGSLDNLPVRAGVATGSPYVGFKLPPPHPILEAVGSRRAAADPTAARWLRRFGVTHAVWDGATEIPGSRSIYRAGDYALDRLAYRPADAPLHRVWQLFRLAQPFPSAHVAHRPVVVRNQRELLERLSSIDALDHATYLPGDFPPALGPFAKTAVLKEWNGVQGVVEHDGACDLVLVRTYYPGWTYRVNGGPERPVTRVDGGLQAVRLEGKGPSRVSIRYRPAMLGPACAVSVTALAVAFIVLAAATLRYARIGDGSRGPSCG